MNVEFVNRYTNALVYRAGVSGIRDDFFAVLDTAPAEVPALLAALRAGKVDGSTYEGECACLVGTIANAIGCPYTAVPGLRPNSDRPAECWFMGIQPGDTPENHQLCKITEGWVLEWQSRRATAAPVQP